MLYIFDPVFWAANRRARTLESADAELSKESGSGEDDNDNDAGPFGSFGCSAFLQALFSSSLFVVSLMISTCFNKYGKY